MSSTELLVVLVEASYNSFCFSGIADPFASSRDEGAVDLRSKLAGRFSVENLDVFGLVDGRREPFPVAAKRVIWISIAVEDFNVILDLFFEHSDGSGLSDAVEEILNFCY